MPKWISTIKTISNIFRINMMTVMGKSYKTVIRWRATVKCGIRTFTKGRTLCTPTDKTSTTKLRARTRKSCKTFRTSKDLSKAKRKFKTSRDSTRKMSTKCRFKEKSKRENKGRRVTKTFLIIKCKRIRLMKNWSSQWARASHVNSRFTNLQSRLM